MRYYHQFIRPLLPSRLVPALDELETTSSKSDSYPSDGEDDDNRSITPQNVHLQPGSLSLNSNSEDDEIGDGLRTYHPQTHAEEATTTDQLHHATKPSSNQTPAQHYSSPVHSKGPTLTTSIVTSPTGNGGGGAVPGERRRRKLPEIPKNKKREKP